MSHAHLLKRLEDYAYRLVFWNASDINTLYASPNKFFESISHSLPPIATPHPQMLEINRLYRCSILSSNFSQEAVVDAMLDAERIFYSDGYLRLLKGCVAASFDALQWPAQFVGVEQFLRRFFPNRPEVRTEAGRESLTGREQARVERLWRNSRRERVVREADELREPSSLGPENTSSVKNSAEKLPSCAPSDQDGVDVEWYLRAYPDVRALGMGAQEHFDWIGKKLGRAPNPGASAKRRADDDHVISASNHS
jgi:hypothetical protein